MDALLTQKATLWLLLLFHGKDLGFMAVCALPYPSLKIVSGT
jgi:hypothetical protein